MKRFLLMLLSIMLVLSLAMTAAACGDGSSDDDTSDGGSGDLGGSENPGDGSGDTDDGSGDTGDGSGDTSDGSDNVGGNDTGTGQAPDDNDDTGDGSDDTGDGENGDNDLPQLPLPDEGDNSVEDEDSSGGDGSVDLPVIPLPKPGQSSELGSYNLLMTMKSPAAATLSAEGTVGENNARSVTESAVITYNSDGSASLVYSFSITDGSSETAGVDGISASVSADGEIICDATYEGAVKRLVYLADTDSFDFTLCESYTESDSVVSMSFLAENGTAAIGAEMTDDFTVHLAKDCSYLVIAFADGGSSYSITVTYS